MEKKHAILQHLPGAGVAVAATVTWVLRGQFEDQSSGTLLSWAALPDLVWSFLPSGLGGTVEPLTTTIIPRSYRLASL